MAEIVAARTRSRRVTLPDTEAGIEAKREPLSELAVKIRAKFEGPEVCRAAGRLHRGWRANVHWQAECVMKVLLSYLSQSGDVGSPA